MYNYCVSIPVLVQCYYLSKPCLDESSCTISSPPILMRVLTEMGTAFVDKFQDLVALHYTETYRAIYGGGEFALAPALSSFTIEHLEWYKMSIKKRENHLRNMIKSVTTGSHLSITSEGGNCQKFSLSASCNK